MRKLLTTFAVLACLVSSPASADVTSAVCDGDGTCTPATTIAMSKPEDASEIEDLLNATIDPSPVKRWDCAEIQVGDEVFEVDCKLMSFKTYNCSGWGPDCLPPPPPDCSGECVMPDDDPYLDLYLAVCHSPVETGGLVSVTCD